MIVETIRYLGTINHFRSFMDEFLTTNGVYWHAPNSETLLVGYSSGLRAPGREGWQVFACELNSEGDMKTTNRRGTILAFEAHPGITTVNFYDGRYYRGASMRASSYSDKPLEIRYFEFDMIGESIKMLADEIKNKIAIITSDKGQTEDRFEEPKTRNLEEWFEYKWKLYHTKGIRLSLRQISKITAYAYGTVKNRHSVFIKGVEKDANESD